MAKDLGLNLLSLTRSIPSPNQQWKVLVED